uniref:PDZ and LIM domain 4 n=1 Tax=Latimeria chalumnae TaxID=7897 RepID=H3ADT4_LATCH
MFGLNIQSVPEEFVPVGSAHNRRAGAFTGAGNAHDSKPAPNVQYNNPIGLYANNNVENSLPAQISRLHVTSPQSRQWHFHINHIKMRSEIDTESDVYKMLQENNEPVSEPKQSGSFRYLQGILEAEGNVLFSEKPDRAAGTRTVRSPVSKLGGTMPGLQMLPQCTRCRNGIVGTIVKARDKLYHPECFMCDDCGLNLKQRGYFFIDEQLYCETHAKERVKPPEGYDVVAVYPN